uniref:Uncharacterized protein n=1 Tax=Zea mays TaxID=4577 RepID=B7ZZ16_MAIZE|nr:unknown [Zea mays]
MHACALLFSRTVWPPGHAWLDTLDQIRRHSASRSGTSSARGTASTPTERGRTGRRRPATGRRLAQTSPSWRPAATARRSASRRLSCSTAGSRQRASRPTGSCTSTASRMRRAQPPAGRRRLATPEARPRLSGYVCYFVKKTCIYKPIYS